MKAEALWPAIEASSAEIIAIHDADVWTEGLGDALRAVQEGAAWAVPHRTVIRLSEAGTRAYAVGEPWEGQESDRRRLGVVGGGVIVAHRDVLLDVPMDPRFVGYGQEDASWGYALRCLVGEPWRGEADLIHLWHPPQGRLSRKYGSLESRRLFRRYYAARKNPEAMRSLIAEGERCASQPKTPA